MPRGGTRQSRAHLAGDERHAAAQRFLALPHAAQTVARQFSGESTNVTLLEGQDGAWTLQLSKVMVATQRGIGDVEEDLQARIEPLGGVTDGWGVEQQLRLPPGEWLASQR